MPDNESNTDPTSIVDEEESRFILDTLDDLQKLFSELQKREFHLQPMVQRRLQEFKHAWRDYFTSDVLNSDKQEQLTVSCGLNYVERRAKTSTSMYKSDAVLRSLLKQKICYYCHKAGHIISQCRYRNRTCFYCGDGKHFIAFCPLKPNFKQTNRLPTQYREKIRDCAHPCKFESNNRNEVRECDTSNQNSFQTNRSINDEIVAERLNPDVTEGNTSPIVNLCNLSPDTRLKLPIALYDTKPDIELECETVLSIIREEVLLNTPTEFNCKTEETVENLVKKPREVIFVPSVRLI